MRLHRINITVTDDLLLAIDNLAVNRSEFFRYAACSVLGYPKPTIEVGRPRGSFRKSKITVDDNSEKPDN